jgi:hypothetical protein
MFSFDFFFVCPNHWEFLFFSRLADEAALRFANSLGLFRHGGRPPATVTI